MAASVLLASAVAGAQSVSDYSSYRSGTRQAAGSNRFGLLEIRFGPYNANVDSEFDGATPYADTFGDTTRFMIGLEFDWQALIIPGLLSFGPGVGWGYTRASGKARLTNPPPDGSTLSGETTALWIMPMYAVGVLRVDALVHQAGIPLVGYVKAGLGAGLWRASDGNGTSEVDGVKGLDISLGYQFALGGMFHLNFVEPQAAQAMDNSSGVNSTYLFIEWYHSQLDNFGAGAMQVGDSTWIAGLAFEF